MPTLRRTIRLPVIFALVFTAGCNEGDWQPNASAAQHTARQKGTPYLLYFTPADNRFGRLIQTSVLDRPPVKLDLQRLAKAQVAAHPTPDHLRYGVNPAQPCLLVCKPDGTRAFVPFYLNPLPSSDAVHLWLMKALQRASSTSPAATAIAR